MTAKPDGIDLTTWEKWDQKSKDKFLKELEKAGKKRKAWYCTRGRTCDGMEHEGYPYRHARGDQWPPPPGDWLVWLLKGGRGCVAPWTRIYDAATGEHRPVEDITEPMVVQGLRGPAATDGAPFLKGQAHQWTVRLTDGNEITVTDQHRFLTPTGWQQLSALHVGSPIASGGHAPETPASAARSAWLSNAHRSRRNGAGSPAGYPTYPHSDGQRPLPAAGSAPAAPPSPADAGAHTRPLSHTDAPDGAAGYSRAYPHSALLPRTHSVPAADALHRGELPGEPLPGAPVPPAFPGAPRSPRTSGPALSTPAAVPGHSPSGPSGSPHSGSGQSGSPSLQPSGAGAPSSPAPRTPRKSPQLSSRPRTDDASDLIPLVPSWVFIASIEYSHFGDYYDLTVPDGEHYTAEGVVGHNSGKTRSGAEWIRKISETLERVSIIGPTSFHVRGTMIEGDSGLLAVFENAGAEVLWEPSKNRLTVPCKCKTDGPPVHRLGHFIQAFTGEEPERLRGPQHAAVWLDEPAHFDKIDAVWDNMLFGLRLGTDPKILCSTTPLPTKWMKELVKRPDTVSVTVSTFANLANLAPTVRKTLAKYEGTRLGRQELYGEILEDIEGALWKTSLIDPFREHDLTHRDMDRIVVSIDPAGTSSKKRDETGIVVIGKKGRDFYVLADLSGHYTPEGWASAAWKAYDEFEADLVVAEKNYGGEMVLSTLRNVRPDGPAKLVHSRRGKVLRAEPVVALYEQERVHHVGTLTELETQMCEWVPDMDDSPDRVDALVHGITELSDGLGPSAIAAPSGDLPLRDPGSGSVQGVLQGFGYTPREHTRESVRTALQEAVRKFTGRSGEDCEHASVFESHDDGGGLICSDCYNEVDYKDTLHGKAEQKTST